MDNLSKIKRADLLVTIFTTWSLKDKLLLLDISLIYMFLCFFAPVGFSLLMYSVLIISLSFERFEKLHDKFIVH